MMKKPTPPNHDVAVKPALSEMSVPVLLSEIKRPQVPRDPIVTELLAREEGGGIESMDDLLVVLRHSHEGPMRMKVLRRVEARAHQLEIHHLQLCLKFCGNDVRYWADLNRSLFNKKGISGSSSEPVLAAAM